MGRTTEILRLPPGRAGMVWYFARARNTRFRPRLHRHRELEFNLVTAGRATYLLQDRRVDIATGSLVWLFPAQDHVLLSQSSGFEMWIVVFRPELVEHTCATPDTAVLKADDPAGLFCKTLSEERAGRLHQLMTEIDASGNADQHNAGMAYLLVSAWAAHQAADEVTAVSDVHPAVERAARLIRDDDQPMKLAELARRSGLSASRLSRLFKKQTGVSLVSYRQRQRLERFLSLYGRGRRRGMHEAALEAGFGSYPQFHRVFRRHMGIGPAEYRRRGVKDGSLNN